jgi:hypothetical protein
MATLPNLTLSRQIKPRRRVVTGVNQRLADSEQR